MPEVRNPASPNRTESRTNYASLRRHPGETSPKLVAQLKEDFLARIEQGLEPQIVDVIAAICDPAQANEPDFPVEVGDGVNRIEALMQLGLPVRVSIRMTPWVRGETVRMRATTVLKRKNATAAEMARVLADCRKEMGFKTWKETGQFLGLSAATVSRILGYNGIPERHREGTENLGAVVLQMAGKVRPVDAMEKVLEFAKTGATKDQVALMIDGLKEKRGAKKKYLEGKIGGRPFRMLLKEKDGTASLKKDFEEAAKKLGKYEDSPPENLGFLFA